VNTLLVIRRLHLYLGLFVAPWVVLFGVSSLPFNHSGLQRPVTWTMQMDRSYDLPVGDGANLREVGGRMLADAGLSGGFYASRPGPQQITVTRPSFTDFRRLIYRIDQKRLTVERRSAGWPQILGAMHTRAGFELGSAGNTWWAILVDVLCVALLLWVATGVIMWWQLPASRNWGWVAIGSGSVLFAVLMATL